MSEDYVNNSANASPSLPPEPQEGNIEYKLKLVNLTDVRLEHLTTQMLWRLEEGNGEAVYQIGVEDCGNLKGLSQAELDYSLRTVTQMAERLNAKITSLTRTRTPSGRWAARVVVRRLPQGMTHSEVRLAMLGAVESGKSTLLGVLSSGMLDNGCGLSRLNLFRHPHEVQTGRTSSMSFEVLGFDNHGRVMNFGQVTNIDMFMSQSTVVTMVDLAGCSKYFKTTVNGLLGFTPHYAALTISAASGPVPSTYEHFSLARALDILIFAVITKKDLLPAKVYENGIENYYAEKVIAPLVQSCRAIGADLEAFFVDSAEDAVKMAKELSYGNKKLLPVFAISNVTGEGVGLLTQFFHALEPRHRVNNVVSSLGDMNSVFYVREVFNIQSVGTVVGGVLTSGILTVEQVVRVGPDAEGNYSHAKVRSLHWSRNPVEAIRPGQYAAICLDFEEPAKAMHLKRGSVLLSLSVGPVATRRFSAVLQQFAPFGPQPQPSSIEALTTVTAPLAVQLHRGGYCQTVACLHLEKLADNCQDQITVLQDENDAPWLSQTRYTCTIDFVERTGFIEVGDHFFIRRHAFRALGRVTEVSDDVMQKTDIEAITLPPLEDPDFFGSSPLTERPPSFQ